jgi:Lrp/AsnC family transcriptional regulator for asnA, asnC and gidA
MKTIDETDLKIIRLLEEDSRLSLRKLAQKATLSPVITHKRISSLEHKGIIRGYVPILDAAKMGYPLTAIIMVQVVGGHAVEVENKVAQENNVLSVFEITGEQDIIIFAKFRDNASLNSFLKELLTERFIKRTTTLIALNAIKEYTKMI